MKEINNTDKSAIEIESLPLVGIIRNNWRQRTVKLYSSKQEGYLYMIGTAFDKTCVILTHEAVGMNERTAMDYWQHGQKVLVRD
jgi:hypothetical protein